MPLDRLGLLIATAFQQHRVSRVIIKHRQRMAPASGVETEMTLEIHLPQIVGSWIFKRGECPVRPARRRFDQIVPMQNPGHRPRRADIGLAQILQPAFDLATTPCPVRLAQLHNLVFQGLVNLARIGMRPPANGQPMQQSHPA